MTDTDVREYAAQAASTDTFGRVLCSARDHHFVVDGPVQNGCLGEAYPGGTAVPFPEESGDTRINVSGNQASLYFECHDIGDYELPTRFIAPDTFLAGTGISSPLSRQVPHSGRCASFCEQPALVRHRESRHA